MKQPGTLICYGAGDCLLLLSIYNNHFIGCHIDVKYDLAIVNFDLQSSYLYFSSYSNNCLC